MGFCTGFCNHERQADRVHYHNITVIPCVIDYEADLCFPVVNFQIKYAIRDVLFLHIFLKSHAAYLCLFKDYLRIGL